MDTATPLPWGIYTRLSEYRPDSDAPPDDPEFSPSRQERDCRATVERLGGHAVRVYSDLDISGWAERPGPDGKLAPLRRPDFDQALADLDSGLIRGLACWKVDRLCRNRKDFERLWDLVKTRGIKLASVHEAFDTTSPHGEFVLAMMVSIAKLESDNLSLRRRSLLAVQAQNGKPHHGGRRPYGFTRAGTGELHPEEAAVLRWAADQLVDGATLAEVCRRLTDQGVTAAEGQPWRPSKLARTLRSPRVAGLRTHHGTLYQGTWPAIIPPEEQAKLIAMLDERTEGLLRPGPQVRSLLSGIARCGHDGCGKPMWIRYRGPGRPGKDAPGSTRRYACVKPPNGRGCGKVAMQAGWLEDIVGDAIIDALAGPRLAEAQAERRSADTGRLGRRLDADRAALEQLAHDYYVEKLIGRGEFLSARHELLLRVGTAQTTIDRAADLKIFEGLPADADGLQAAWADRSLEWRRQLVEAMLKAVVVKPAAKPGRDPTRGRGRVLPDGLLWRV